MKLLALDVDGTLLNSGGIITDAVKQGVNNEISRGTTVVIATGRTICEIDFIFSAFPKIRYAIIANGAGIWDVVKKSFIYNNPLPHNAVRAIYDMVSDMPLLIEFYSNQNVYDTKKGWDSIDLYNAEYIKEHLAHTRTILMDMEELLAVETTPIDKINLFFQDNKVGLALEKKFCNLPISITHSAEQGMEINSATASKGNALSWLCKHIGITNEEVAAIGDSANDVSMFGVAGISIAMGNANKAISNKAMYIAPSCDEEGVAYAIKNILARY